MEKLAPLKTLPEHPRRTLPPWVWRRGLLLAAAAFVSAAAGLAAWGLPLWQALLWAAALAVPVPVRLRVGKRAGAALSRLFWCAAPVAGYCLVEVLNYNSPFADFSPLQVGLNLCFYYLAALLLWLAAGRRNLSAGLTAALFWCIGMANHYVISFRGRTIFPGDLLTLGTAANVAGNYSYGFDTTQLLTALALGVFLLTLLALPRQEGRSRPRLRSTLPALLLGGGFLWAFFATPFLSAAGVSPDLWTTRGNGFVLNFSTCLRYSSVSQPEGYSQAALESIAGGVRSSAAPALGAGTGATPENVIVIMNESLSDLTGTFGLETNKDPMPFLRSLTENTVKGTAYASVFGGTTANSEYEFLTGNTMAFLPAGTVPYHMYVKDGSESMVAQMKALGYECVAMHPYWSSGWNRVSVYGDFGFDRWYFLNDLTGMDTMRGYVTDQSNYETLIQLYEEKEEGRPLFLFNVTMQNHSGYSVPWTNLPREVWLTGARQGRYATVDQYLNLVYQSDRAFQGLVEYFSQVEEPTMILMFGDHQPQVSTTFYDDVLGKTPDAAAAQKKQAVPFVLWANYDIPEQAGVETSLNYLSSLLMEAAGLPLTGYQQFAAETRALVPAVNAVGCMDASGVWHADAATLPQAARDALDRYRMLQYNELFDGRENRLKDFFFLPQSP